jgi:6,7-dimethyl-8-ribityllumazine synthase
VGIAVSAFNRPITERLLSGARKALRDSGVPASAISVIWVPGAFELPLAVRALADAGCGAVVGLGCVIRGETPHFEYVAAAAAQGLQRVALDTGVPVGFGVLTTENSAQAEARSGGGHGNKGADAVLAALAMSQVLAAVGRGEAAARTRRASSPEHTRAG